MPLPSSSSFYFFVIVLALFLLTAWAFQSHSSNSSEPSRRHHIVGSHKYRGSNKELCTEIKKYPGKSNGAFITRDPGHWRYLPDGSMTYEVSTCALKRFTAPEARRCLANHHMLLIGDSLMRYQFLSLVYFIEHGHWPERFAMANPHKGESPDKDCKHFDNFGNPTCSPPGHPNILSENDWGKVYGDEADKSWRAIHQFIGGEGMNGHVECQCSRSDGEKSTEVMFYEHTFKEPAIASAIPLDATTKQNKNDIANASSEGHNRVRLSFFSNLGDIKAHMWNRTYCERTGSCNLTSDQWYSLLGKAEKYSWDIQDSIENVITTHLPKIIPDVDVAIFNRGSWGGDNPPKTKEIMRRLFALVHGIEYAPGPEGQVAKKAGRCYWRGRSPQWSNDHNGYPEHFAERDNGNRVAAYDAGCGVYDVRHVTKQFASFQWMGDLGRPSCCGEKEMMAVYFDAAHFQPWVNEELNQILLNQLC